MRTRLRRRGLLAVAVAGLFLLAGAVGSVAPAAADPAVTQVMRGLDNPRGLGFGPQGALYVAEAGRGGAGLENPFCFSGALGGMRCYGPTGGVSRLWRGKQERVVTGLASHANPNGSRADGPHDISLLGVGAAYVTIGLEGDPTVRDRLAEQVAGIAGFASLVKVEPSGEWRSVADLGAYEEANNPDGRLHDDGTPFLDSNPYGVLAGPGGPLVTDAGGNSLLRVRANGEISLLAVFQSRGSTPPRPSHAPPQFDQFTDAVPTSVVIGPDGGYYVSELTGVPFVDQRANIYRVVPGEAPRLFLTSDACLGGFKMIIDVAFDEQANLYVLQFATGALQQTGPGILVRITPDRSVSGDICAQYRAGTRTVVLGGPGQFQLTQPTSIAVGPDGALYVSNHGISAGGGEVLRVEP
jgi:hypothetical protein